MAEQEDLSTFNIPGDHSIVIGNTPVPHPPLVIEYPDEGRVVVEEADPENPVLGGYDGLKVLVRAFKELQALDNDTVHAILQRHKIRYEEPLQ